MRRATRERALPPGAARRSPIFTAGARRGLRSPVFRWSVLPALVGWGLLWSVPHAGAAWPLCLAPRPGAGPLALGGAPALASEIGLMLLATMPPLIAPMIGHVASRSFPDRRERASACFALGYGLVWAAAAIGGSVGLALAAAAVGRLGPLGPATVGAAGCAGAAAWQLSGAKRSALARCHRLRPVRAGGPGADRDLVSFGLGHGWRCLRACGPTMALPMAGGHGPLPTLVTFAVLMAERTAPRPRQEAAAALLLGLALLTALAMLRT